jgi:hypothetical protein
MIHEGHYLEFTRLAQAESGWKGSIPSAWVRSLPSYAGGDVPERHLKRGELRAFCQSVSNSSEACFVACMAWGGMDRRNGAKALGVRSALLAMIDGIRRGGISRTEAYERFHSAVVPGLAPAYFTKLIHFMRPEGGWLHPRSMDGEVRGPAVRTRNHRDPAGRLDPQSQ